MSSPALLGAERWSRPQASAHSLLTGMLSHGQGCMLGTVVPCSLYVLKSQVSLWACSFTLPCLPLMCHVMSGVLDAVFSSQLGRGLSTPLPCYLGASQSQKCIPLPQEPFLVHRQGVCMRAHAAGVGAMSVCPLPSALLLPSDCDHCPCCLLSRPLPPPLHQRSWYNQLPIL